MFDLEEREFISSILLPDFSGLLIAQELAIEPPPTFPFLESQCQRAQLGANFHLAREATPFARPCLTSGVGGVYRRVNLLCQMRNRGEFRFFVNRFAHPTHKHLLHPQMLGSRPDMGRIYV
jgi:hypothetical protein